MNNIFLFAVLILAPLAGFVFNGLRFRSRNCALAGAVATVAALVSFLASIALVARIADGEGPKSVGAFFFDWISVAGFDAKASFVVDRISAIMALTVTGVGTLIHLFSVGYMSHDDRPSKYFAYLNLFLFNMLLLVLGDNLLAMFVGWEGVGLCLIC